MKLSSSQRSRISSRHRTASNLLLQFTFTKAVLRGSLFCVSFSGNVPRSRTHQNKEAVSPQLETASFQGSDSTDQSFFFFLDLSFFFFFLPFLIFSEGSSAAGASLRFAFFSEVTVFEGFFKEDIPEATRSIVSLLTE